ncbi:protein sneaky [Diorhabda carinulata]|uniref:protein sneaky n=1 Tax=Diorhabda carinulata TaxID=1163345 RepID=UPI0025A17D83|nr:protein sneaky [Diorhabda carinulata]
MAREKFCKATEKFLKRIPFFSSLFCSGKYEHVAVKKLFGFFFGLFLGFSFYKFILVDLDFTEDAAIIVGSIICLMMAFGYAFSSQIRCITCLTFPIFGGKVGRGVLKALVIAFVLSGPVENVAKNGREVVRVFACTAALTYNMTKTRFELMFKPFTQAIFGMKTDMNEVKDTLRSIKDVSAPITGEIEDEREMKKMKEENDYLDLKMGDTKRSQLEEDKYKTKGEQIEAERYEKLYMEKIEVRCENQFTKAANRCRKMFANGYNACYDTVTWLAAWLLCWPMKLDFICNIAESLGGNKRCDPQKDMDPGFGEGYSYLKHSRSFLSKNFKDVKLQYKLSPVKALTDIRNARDTAKSIWHEVNRKKMLLFQILTIIKRLLAFIFLKILLESQNYHDKYLRDIEFDNFYITRYFRKIDARRKQQEKYTLLPLKKIETKKLVDPSTFTPLKSERAHIKTEAILMLLEMLTITILVLLDRLFYEALDIIRRHARIDYLQTGHHDLTIDVKGTGMIASLLRSLVKGFNIKKRIRIERTNEKCLPRPNLLLSYYLYKIYGTYFAVLVAMFLQAYCLRFRRVICSYFYRKREKKRVLYLYNETLKRRKGFFRFMRKKVRRMVRENRLKEDFTGIHILRINHPKACDWLRIFPFARRKCLICEDPEPRRANQENDFIECPNDFCHFIYCQECWSDMGNVCLACQTETEETTSGFDDDSEDDTDF